MITGVWTVDVGGEGSGVDVDGVSFNLSLWLRQSTVSCLDSSKTELFNVYIVTYCSHRSKRISCQRPLQTAWRIQRSPRPWDG